MPDPIIVELRLPDGNPVSVNLALVTHWEPADDDQTIISFSDTDSVIVMDSYDTVSEYLNPERQAGE